MFRRHDPDDEDLPRRRRASAPDRSWSSRLAWLALVGGVGLVVVRMSFATVVQVHGDGMAPTLVDRDHVVITRDPWSLERGDIVLYDPDQARPGSWDDDQAPHSPQGAHAESAHPDARKDPQGTMRNTGIPTSVVDREALDENWERVQARSDGIAKLDRAPLRLGRVLAVPGDTVTFHGQGGALGLSINGAALPHKLAEPIRIRLEEDAEGPTLRTLAYETTDARRYPVLVRSDDSAPDWPGLQLPPAEFGPVEMPAPGYLVVADNRDGGACCDSRALGWLPGDALRGRVLLRLTGDPTATPDLDPSARGILWKP